MGQSRPGVGAAAEGGGCAVGRSVDGAVATSLRRRAEALGEIDADGDGALLTAGWQRSLKGDDGLLGDRGARR